jgi:SAM-dependent methyltransferase
MKWLLWFLFSLITTKPDMQFEKWSNEYVQLAKLDPNKQYVQYPEAIRLMGNLEGEDVIDIGCGNGTLTEMMARRGARADGYDPSPEQIKAAQTKENKMPLGIKYFVSDRPPIPGKKYDIATAILVLNLAADQKQLADILGYASSSLKDGGKFVAIVLNPNYQRFGVTAHNRRITKTGKGRKIHLEFLDDNGKLLFPVTENYFSQEEYETALRNAGFKSFSWEILKVDQQGIQKKGFKFWENFEEDCPYIGLIAHK